MIELLPTIYLARHGETAWSLTGQHTGLTDLPLTEHGEVNARSLRNRLAGVRFAKVFSSPLQRAWHTCELAGFGGAVEIDRDLLEWDYGDYEGRRGADIRKERPDWQLFRDGCPGGETPKQVAERADRVISSIRAINDDVLIFSMSIERTAGLDMLPEDEVTLEPSWIKWTNRCQDEHSMRYQVAHSHKTSATGSASWNDSNWLGESPSDAGCELSERLHGLE